MNREELRAYNAAYRAANREKIRTRDATWQKNNVEKMRTSQEKYRAANLDKRRSAHARWYKNTKEKHIAKSMVYNRLHPEILRASGARWRAAHPDRVNAISARRRAGKIQATPSWADVGRINNIYREATYLRLHVDHVIPLKHPLVCGLHVPDNLQLLTPHENATKYNKVDLNNATLGIRAEIAGQE